VDCSDCPNISLNVTVTDPSTPDVVLTLLDEDNFSLYQDDVLQVIGVGPIQNPSTVSLVLALDWSSSTENVRANIQTAAKTFMDLLADGDEAAICKFNANREFNPTTNTFISGATPDTLKTYIEQPYSGEGTTLYDTIIACVDRAGSGTKDKRAVIILCDGVDTASENTLDQAIAYAKFNGIPVFAIFFYDTEYQGGDYGDPETMQELASETGGQYYTADTADLDEIFAWIANTLSNTYTINYTAIDPGCTGTAVIRVHAVSGALEGEASRTVTLD